MSTGVHFPMMHCDVAVPLLHEPPVLLLHGAREEQSMLHTANTIQYTIQNKFTPLAYGYALVKYVLALAILSQ